MRKEYANAFLAAYGKQLGKLVFDGRKKALQFNTSNLKGAQLNREFAEHGERFAVLGQAIRAYFSDLRAGRYVNTAVEVAIWGILLDEEPDLIDAMKPGLWDFVMDNYEERVPEAENVFAYDNDGVDRNYQPASSESPKSKAQKIRKPIKSSNNQAVEKGDDPNVAERQKVYAALISMLGRKRADAVLSRLWANDLVRTSIGLKMPPESFGVRVSLGLKWLTEALQAERGNRGMLASLRSANKNFFDTVFGLKEYVMTDQQVADLITDLMSYMSESECYISGPKGKYLEGLDEFYLGDQ
ncbi:hypothetical protein [Marinobacter salsuginis]|uniref:Uncharacterized protein n=1 Tax=Marinobacter salsuginis TaxID=418719 RepID=A0A5M3PX08_9GAMM|nr:hypothetical protein [Marinobacter salsuginis]GBO87525.1 hypothetical protein MSSD14B_11930 [Marinobacter salsuginis]